MVMPSHPLLEQTYFPATRQIETPRGFLLLCPIHAGELQLELLLRGYDCQVIVVPENSRHQCMRCHHNNELRLLYEASNHPSH
jgi:hypothetical protein